GHGLGGSDAHNNFPPPETAMARQKPRRRRAELWRPNAVGGHKFHRGSVSGVVLDRCDAAPTARNCRPAAAFVGAEHPTMHTSLRGSSMTQSIDRRPSSRAARALVLISAVLLVPTAFSSAASAQMLGYASTQ